MLNDPNRCHELFILGIQPEYIRWFESVKVYACSDGQILHRNLTAYKHNPFNSAIKIKGKPYSRSMIVFQAFIDSHVTHSPFALDGNVGNCRIDNLEYHSKELKALE
jgi:hypothetical protein